MSYVDGYVLPVPKSKVEAYRAIASKAGAIWREHGALEYRECVAEDVKPGQVTSFPQSVLLQPDEVVVFAFIVFESRAHRDAGTATVMSDPRLEDMSEAEMPADMKRMVYGGFETIVEY